MCCYIVCVVVVFFFFFLCLEFFVFIVLVMSFVACTFVTTVAANQQMFAFLLRKNRSLPAIWEELKPQHEWTQVHQKDRSEIQSLGSSDHWGPWILWSNDYYEAASDKPKTCYWVQLTRLWFPTATASWLCGWWKTYDWRCIKYDIWWSDWADKCEIQYIGSQWNEVM